MVMGPAGTGKSTYCKVIQEHCQNTKRTVHVVNLDPAAEAFEYEVAFDIRGDGCFLRTMGAAASLAVFGFDTAAGLSLPSQSQGLPRVVGVT